MSPITAPRAARLEPTWLDAEYNQRAVIRAPRGDRRTLARRPRRWCSASNPGGSDVRYGGDAAETPRHLSGARDLLGAPGARLLPRRLLADAGQVGLLVRRAVVQRRRRGGRRAELRALSRGGRHRLHRVADGRGRGRVDLAQRGVGNLRRRPVSASPSPATRPAGTWRRDAAVVPLEAARPRRSAGLQPLAGGLADPRVVYDLEPLRTSAVPAGRPSADPRFGEAAEPRLLSPPAGAPVRRRRRRRERRVPAPERADPRRVGSDGRCRSARPSPARTTSRSSRVWPTRPAGCTTSRSGSSGCAAEARQAAYGAD